jgi:hypothetical protein
MTQSAISVLKKLFSEEDLPLVQPIQFRCPGIIGNAFYITKAFVHSDKLLATSHVFDIAEVIGKPITPTLYYRGLADSGRYVIKSQ